MRFIGLTAALLTLGIASSGAGAETIVAPGGKPGVATKWTAKGGSVTFPDGTYEGYISVTQVHADKVPMAPPKGFQPRFIITIQPPGAVFDPPAPITLRIA